MREPTLYEIASWVQAGDEIKVEAHHHQARDSRRKQWSVLRIGRNTYLEISREQVRRLRDGLNAVLEAWPESHGSHSNNLTTCRQPSENSHQREVQCTSI